MGFETNISGFITGKFTEIRSRIPVKLNGFLTTEAGSAVNTESFEEQLSKSGAAVEAGSGSQKQSGEAADDTLFEMARNAVVFFPNIIREPEEPIPEAKTSGSGDADIVDKIEGDESNSEDGSENLYSGQYPFDGVYYDETGEEDISASADGNIYADGTLSVDEYASGYPDNFDEYGINDYDWNAGAWENYAGGGLAEDDDLEYTADMWDEEGYFDGIYGAAEPQTSVIIEDAILQASMRYGIDPNLIRAVIQTESSYKTDCLSSAGAQGLMQLMPETAASLGVTDPWNIYDNINGGTKLLRNHLESYNGDLSLTLAAYNAGAGAVKKYGGMPPYSETQTYVKKVIGYYDQYSNGVQNGGV